jgi:signal transduction histidine kinase
MPPAVRRLHTRAILVYLGTIVVPVCALVWLGLQSFERQREALNRLAEDRFRAELAGAARAEAAAALGDPGHPIVTYPFVIERGEVTSPALYAPLPRRTPERLVGAERLLADGRPADALAAYRSVIARRPQDCLALQGVAVSLERLGQREAARDAWRTLALDHPDEQTLSHRPFGIVAAINAGRTEGLAERIAEGRWELPADQAEYFLAQLGVQADSPLFDRVRFARVLHRESVPASRAEIDGVASYDLGQYRLYYRQTAPGRLEGFAADLDWIDDVLGPRVTAQLGLAESGGREALVYGGAIGVVLITLSAGVLLLVQDVTREARTNQLRADFVSGVTHELKTPITLIRLYGETLLRHRELPEGERRESLRIITRESARLGRLIDQVLAFSRVERGDDTYQWQVGDPAPVIAGVIDDYAGWLERSGFELRRDLADALPEVRFDPGALSQAVVNLIDNALKYSGASRTIDVRLRADSARVVFEVEDHGIGIAASEREKVFDRFYRSAKGTGKGGYGLGLYMVSHIVRAHGGRIDVESEVGEGSTFRLTLPVVSS